MEYPPEEVAKMKEQFIAALYKEKTVQRAVKIVGVDRTTLRRWEGSDPKFSQDIQDFREYMCDLFDELAYKKLRLLPPDAGDKDNMKWLNDNLLLGLMRMQPKYRDGAAISATLQLQVIGADMQSILQLGKPVEQDGAKITLKDGPSHLPQSEVVMELREKKEIEDAVRREFKKTHGRLHEGENETISESDGDSD